MSHQEQLKAAIRQTLQRIPESTLKQAKSLRQSMAENNHLATASKAQTEQLRARKAA